MYNVMIVEDEMFVRLGFKNSVPWSKYGMTVCADVANGKDAWDLYNGAVKPDIIITDLRMPQMSGMELIENIRKHDTRTRIVILSCLEDFELVRKAMKMDVSNYILKLTMTDEEIDNVLKQVRDELGQQSELEKSQGIIRNPFSTKENIVKNFVFYNLYSEDEFVRHAANLKLQLHPERLMVCMMELDHFDQVQTKFKDEKGELIRVTFLNVLNELLDGSQRGEVVSDEDNRYMFIFSFHDMVSERQIRELLHQTLSQIQKVLRRFFNISVTFGISSMRNDYLSLRSLYRESTEAIKHKFFYGTGSLIFHQELEAESIPNMVSKHLHKLSEAWAWLGQSGRMELESIVQAAIEETGIHSEDEARKLFLRLLHSSALSVFSNEKEGAMLVSTFGEAIQHCETLAESLDAIADFLNELAALRNKHKQLRKEIARAVQYIQDHYHSDISVQQLAVDLQMTPNYVSALFKKELEITFTEYLNRVRLERAKELLLTTSLKSYEIAEQVGFSDDSYFSRAFKKYAGIRPNGFRRQWVYDAVGGNEMDNDE